MIYLYGLIVFVKRIKYLSVLNFHADSNIQRTFQSCPGICSASMNVFLSQHAKFQWVLVIIPVFGLEAT